LNVSPPTLSEHLAQFERELNVQLFHRQHRKLTLTPQGSKLFVQAKQMFELGRRVVDVVSPIPLGCYPVSIGLVPSPASFEAHGLISRYSELYGPVDLKIRRVSQKDLEKGLAQADFDFAFTDCRPERKDLVARKIARSTVKFYVAGALKGRSLEDLVASVPLIVCADDPTAKSAAERALSELELHPVAVIETDYFVIAAELCRQGRGIGVLSEASVRAEREAFSEVPKAPRLEQDLYAVWTQDAENTEAVKNLLALLQTKPAGLSKRRALEA
ncbi:MAG TPA: LysR family transcriptional regulator, partial [Bdellovibrionales bacterium]|nr:LysR family transcriptional regulator [Bdellovibrionales bacterium]